MPIRSPGIEKSPLSRGTLELLLDLLEIKLSCLEVYDREDARERRNLEHARTEVSALLGRPVAVTAAARTAPRRPGLLRAH